MAVAKYKIVRGCPVYGEKFFARILESWYCSPKCSKMAWECRHDEEKHQLKLGKIVSNMPKSREYIGITEAYVMFGTSHSAIYRLIYMKEISLIEPEKGVRLVCKGELMSLFPLRQSSLDTKPRKPVTMYRMEPEDCYTIGEVSKKLHLGDSTVYAHIRKYSMLIR